MIQFKDIPYLRPDLDALEREMTAGTEQFRRAKTKEEAYYSLLALEFPRRYYITMATICEAYNTMDTNDACWAEEWAWFSQTRPRWDALVKDLGDAMNASAFREDLRFHLGDEIFRHAEMTGRAFSAAITPELEEEGVLSARYSRLTANLSLTVDGKRCSLGEISRMEDRSDRSSREKVDTLRQKAFAQAAPELDELYDKLVAVRNRMAKKLGFASYTDMGYCKQGRTGYSREEVAAFRKAIETNITPVVSALFEKQRRRLGYDALYNFDEDVDFAGAAPKLLSDAPVDELFEPIFGSLSPESKVYYQDLRRGRFYDLQERPGKIRGAYSNNMPLYGLPFIFETFDGSPRGIKTFAHECGHGLHSYTKRGEPFIDNCDATSDICEIHSMAMEFFVWPYLGKLYNEEDVKKYQFFHMKSALTMLPYGAAVDEFQTEIYDHPELTPAQRLELWKRLEQRYMPWKHYSCPDFLAQGRRWQQQTHIYKWPFYYIDYVLAQVCALQYHFMDEENHENAWNSYLTLLRESGRHSFHDTLRIAGLESPFAPGVVKKLGEKAMAFLEGME